MNEFPTTGEHYTAFKEAIEKYSEMFHLGEYKIETQHATDCEDSRCSYHAHIENKTCVFYLSSEWEFEPTTDKVIMCAYHEVMELVLFEFQLLAEDRSTTQSDLERVRHAIIRRWENVRRKKGF